jgi:sigma-B regulation protein RsbU (phosphoserine phosphatase)
MDVPVVLRYQKALDDFRRGAAPPGAILKRMSELISLLDLTTTLSSGLSSAEILEASLLVALGELNASRGGLFVRSESGGFELRASRGLPVPNGSTFVAGSVDSRSQQGMPAGLDQLGIEAVCPIRKDRRTIAVLGVGGRLDGTPRGEEDMAFLASVAACATTPIENGLIHRELQRVNQRLSLKIFQLHNLFDISRELSAAFDEEAIKNLLTTTLMGQLMVSRCAMFLAGVEGLALAHARGVAASESVVVFADEASLSLLAALREPIAVAALEGGPLVDLLGAWRLPFVVPMAAGERVEGFVALGEKASGAPFGEEDLDFALTLARQGLSAIENVRLHRVRLEKLRQDRELQIAREIQQSLFPRSFPSLRGFEIAAESHPCYQVGGDSYDVIPLDDSRVAIAVADVSGKGTPASILMASVHASLHALSGAAAPGAIIERLNRFLCANTQPNKFVTLVYAELDPRSGCLRYVNAGHIPPLWLRATGRHEELVEGGPVLGLIDDATFATGEIVLSPGDSVAIVTDGATEAVSPADEEFGVDRVVRALADARHASAAQAVRALIGAVKEWTGTCGCRDDLTALLLKAG